MISKVVYRIKSAIHVLIHEHCLSCEECFCDVPMSKNPCYFISPEPQDFVDLISKIKIEDTPFMSALNRNEKKSKHEWITK